MNRARHPKHLFAPGTVEGYRRGWTGTPARRRSLLRYLVALVILSGAALVLALLLGLVSGSA